LQIANYHILRDGPLGATVTEKTTALPSLDLNDPTEARLAGCAALIAWFQIVGALPSTGRVSSLPTFGKLDRKNWNPRSRAEMPLP
jgi:hypothetical protein